MNFIYLIRYEIFFIECGRRRFFNYSIIRTFTLYQLNEEGIYPSIKYLTLTIKNIDMHNNFKNIDIGKLIHQRMKECSISIERATAFLKISEEDLERIFTQKSLDSETLLRCSKLLKYDFFRVYSQHLILYSPQDSNIRKNEKMRKTSLPVFKKNIYTKEVILYLVELVENGNKTCQQIQHEYNIPATTILRWHNKYGKTI